MKWSRSITPSFTRNRQVRTWHARNPAMAADMALVSSSLISCSIRVLADSRLSRSAARFPVPSHSRPCDLAAERLTAFHDGPSGTFCSTTGGYRLLTHYNNVQTSRTVGAKNQRLRDVGRARRASDQVDGA